MVDFPPVTSPNSRVGEVTGGKSTINQMALASLQGFEPRFPYRAPLFRCELSTRGITASWAARRQGQHNQTAKPVPFSKAMDIAFPRKVHQDQKSGTLRASPWHLPVGPWGEILSKRPRPRPRVEGWNRFLSLVPEKYSACFLISRKIAIQDSPTLCAPQTVTPLA